MRIDWRRISLALLVTVAACKTSEPSDTVPLSQSEGAALVGQSYELVSAELDGRSIGFDEAMRESADGLTYLGGASIWSFHEHELRMRMDLSTLAFDGQPTSCSATAVAELAWTKEGFEIPRSVEVESRSASPGEMDRCHASLRAGRMAVLLDGPDLQIMPPDVTLHLRRKK